VLYYFDTKYPEMLQPEVNAQVFEWLQGFFSAVAPSIATQRFSREVKDMALSALNLSPDAAHTLAVELGLKSPTTLQFWKFEHTKLTGSSPDAVSTASARQLQVAKRRSLFAHEKELVEWLLSNKNTPITNHDIVTHLQTQYPEFVQGRSSASVSVWVARFLKRNLPSENSTQPLGHSDHDELGSVTENGQDLQAENQEFDDADDPQNLRSRRVKRKSPNGYVLHSNEFKLNALKLLDEGKAMNEVVEELGIKCPNTLVYWNSIRDKLEVADKKRFRLAGGGRRSTCTFEDELMSWVSDRHQKGLGKLT
jgi:transposase-like protein